MPPKNKVLNSPHYSQILDWISEGKSSRWISRELENQFNESIGHVAISNFRNKYIENEALEILDSKLKEESGKEKQIESKKEKIAKNRAKNISEGKRKVKGLADAKAEQYKGIFNVAQNFEEDYNLLKKDLKKEDSKTTPKDVVDMSYKAAKLAHEIGKSDSIDVNINEGFGDLADAIKKSREKFKD